MQNWSNILESFITKLYDFEKQWLNSFAWKAIVIGAVPQKFSFLVKRRNGTFKNEKKNVRKKFLIWQIFNLGKMVKK